MFDLLTYFYLQKIIKDIIISKKNIYYFSIIFNLLIYFISKKDNKKYYRTYFENLLNFLINLLQKFKLSSRVTFK